MILLSQILNYDLSTGRAEINPGIDLPYVLALPTYAATAWYHHRAARQSRPAGAVAATKSSISRMADYAQALGEARVEPPPDARQIAEKLHDYTGLPVDYIEKADLRINGGEFEQNLLADNDTTTGRLEPAFSGPTLDPLSQEGRIRPAIGRDQLGLCLRLQRLCAQEP